MVDLVSAGILLIGGLLSFWLFVPLWRTIRTSSHILDRNRVNVGTIVQNLVGINPISNDPNGQEHGEAIVFTGRLDGDGRLPSGVAVPTARISSHYVNDVLQQR